MQGIKSDRIDIINRILSHMSLTEVVSQKEHVRRAEKIDLFFDSCFEEILARHDWNWATRKKKLTHVVRADMGESCQFEYPYDYNHGVGLSCGALGVCCCMHNNQVNFRRVDSNIEVDFIGCGCCCNDHDFLVYVANSFVVAEWTPLFQKAFEFCVAYQTIENFRSDAVRTKELKKNYEEYFDEAVKADNRESNKLKYPAINNCYPPFFKRCNRRYR